ncbi:homocitrate synthase, mitochondrial precursor [Metarhizium brunneum]
MVGSRDYVMSRYKLNKIKEIEDMVADAVQIKLPFNNPITEVLTILAMLGFCAFTHKAGIHAKAILANPSTFASRLTGWNAIKSRVEQLGLSLSDEQVKEVTAKIKQMADIRPLAIDDTDSIPLIPFGAAKSIMDSLR